MTYDLYDQQGYCRLTTQDRARLLDYLRARSRLPPKRGTRPYTLHIREPGRVTLKLDLRMATDGQITVTGVTTYQALRNMPIEDALGRLLNLAAPTFEPEMETSARSVWERLRDPWPPRDPEPVPEPPAGWSQADWESFVRWVPDEHRAPV